MNNTNNEKNSFTKVYELIRLIFRAVAVAMGVAVVTLTIMNNLSITSGFMLLGIGVAATGIAALMNKNSKD